MLFGHQTMEKLWPKLLLQFSSLLLSVVSGDRFEPQIIENSYKVVMKLTIKSVEINDFGSYKCVAKNSLGDTDGAIKLYRKYFLNLCFFTH